MTSRLLKWSVIALLAGGLMVPAAVAVAAAAVPAKVVGSVSKRTPLPKTSVTVKATVKDASGKGVAGAKVVFTWKFKTGAVKTKATTNSSGVASSAKNIGSAYSGYKVVVPITATAGGKTVKGSTYFTPTAPLKRVSVKYSGGYYYSPSRIYLTPGQKSALTFAQGTGCLASVQSPSLGFNVNVTSGPKTVNLGGHNKGTYGFACGMNMIKGSVVVQ
jgi:Cupredoxin-like domain